MKFNFCLTLLTLSTLFGCAHQVQAPIQLTSKEYEDMNREALAIASQRLGTMVASSKNDPVTKNYLASDLFLKANMSLLSGDYATSSELFKHLYNLVPDDAFVQKKYSISLIRGGELELAQSVLENLWKSEKEEKVGLILAGVYAGLERDEKSVEIYKQVLSLNKKSEDACIFLSKGYVVQKKNEMALAQLKACSKDDPKNGMFDFYIGKLLQDMGKKKEAILSYKSSLKKQPELTASVSSLGSIYEEMENFSVAVEIYKNHLKQRPLDREILTRVVNGLFLMERYEEVIGYTEVLSDLESDNLNLKVKLGVLYTDTKQYPKAIGMFKDLLKIAPDSDKILYYMGAIYQEMSSYESSIEYFNKINPESGLYTDSSLQVANMLSHLALTSDENSGWHSAFLKHVDNRYSKLPEYRVEFGVLKASYFETKGHIDQATASLELLKNDKKFSEHHVYYYANLLNKVSRFEDSTALVEGLIKKDPKNAHAWNFLGYSLLERRVDLDKAYNFISKAVEIAPEDGYIRDSLGWYYYLTGNLDKALIELNYALKKVPADIEILKHLAIVHKDLRNFNMAKSFIDKALDQAKLEDERQRVIAVMEDIESDRLPASDKDN